MVYGGASPQNTSPNPSNRLEFNARRIFRIPGPEQRRAFSYRRHSVFYGNLSGVFRSIRPRPGASTVFRERGRRFRADDAAVSDYVSRSAAVTSGLVAVNNNRRWPTALSRFYDFPPHFYGDDRNTRR